MIKGADEHLDEKRVGQGIWEGVQSFHAFSGYITLLSQQLHVFDRWEALQTPYYRDLYGGFII